MKHVSQLLWRLPTLFRLGGSVDNVLKHARMLSDNGSVLKDKEDHNVLNRIVPFLLLEWCWIDLWISAYVSRRLGFPKSSRVGFEDVRKMSQNSAYEAESSLVSSVSYCVRLEAGGSLTSDKLFPSFGTGVRLELTLSPAAAALSWDEFYYI